MNGHPTSQQAFKLIKTREYVSLAIVITHDGEVILFSYGVFVCVLFVTTLVNTNQPRRNGGTQTLFCRYKVGCVVCASYVSRTRDIIDDICRTKIGQILKLSYSVNFIVHRGNKYCHTLWLAAHLPVTLRIPFQCRFERSSKSKLVSRFLIYIFCTRQVTFDY